MSEFTKQTKLPDSAIPILRYLENHGQKTQRELIQNLNLPTRTVRYSIRRLIERGLIKKMPNLRDMRSVFYVIDSSVLDVEAVISEELALKSHA
ncbi:MAG: MarR family transcriptional regulator [Candidatus Heimdallarchaeota archaeon]|nr:MarR family transcriptional regulator [Candidatus Heimdallarchaeota archaeon]